MQWGVTRFYIWVDRGEKDLKRIYSRFEMHKNFEHDPQKLTRVTMQVYADRTGSVRVEPGRYGFNYSVWTWFDMGTTGSIQF
jgi:hypothetical protein